MWCYCYCIVTNCSWLFFPGVKQWQEQDSKLGRGRSCWLGKNGDGGGELWRNFAMPLLNSAACKECVWKMFLWNGDKQTQRWIILECLSLFFLKNLKDMHQGGCSSSLSSSSDWEAEHSDGREEGEVCPFSSSKSAWLSSDGIKEGHLGFDLEIAETFLIRN